MAINIEDFRKSLNIGLSRDLVQKILTKYENFDFSSVNTNNGTKLREIDAYDSENVSELEPEVLSYFLNTKLKTDYLVSRGAYLKAYTADKETQRDKKVMATGVVTNLSQTLTEEFDDNVPDVRSFCGEPIHSFKHIYVNDDRKKPNNVFYIMSGLTPVNDKINLISDRIDEIEEEQKVMLSDDALDTVQLSNLSDKIADKIDDEEEKPVDLKNIFGKFDF